MNSNAHTDNTLYQLGVFSSTHFTAGADKTHNNERTRARRIHKAIVAGVLGIGLLAAGGGTFAKWYETEQIGSGNITAGRLDMTVASPIWTANGNPTPIDLATFKMVPGDALTYKTNVTPTLEGDNLQALLTVDKATITGDLAKFLTVDTTVGGLPNKALTETDSGSAAPVVVTLVLPFTTGDGTGGATGENTSVDLTSMALTLTQVDPTTP